MLTIVLLFLFSVTVTVGDVYFHSPRGSNNRLSETSGNVQNQNRLFNSQDNDNGGYAWGPPMYYYVGSILPIEWTNQHSCGTGNANCNVVLQYMCDPTLRDGNPLNYSVAINTINVNVPDEDQLQLGRHETIDYYQTCIQRQRNMRLFTADQNLGGSTARFTRQQPGGNQYGTECPEERDYYPYWAYTPWKDIAIFTDNTSLCTLYQSQSQNVASRGNCSKVAFNNQFDCLSGGGQWSTIPSWGIPPPACLPASWTRDNHLGNTLTGQMFGYNWTVPNDVNGACALRVRYNITTMDYNGWETDATSNTLNSPIYEYETVDIGAGTNLQLAIQTNEYGRTFQDRSYQFAIRARPSTISSGANIYNLNIRGKRGNIVQVYPSVEYDYVPNRLSVTTSDYIHFQWTGSDYNPTNYEGNGTPGTDRSNIVQISSMGKNIPMNITSVSLLGNAAQASLFATLGQNDPLLNNATTPYFDGGVVKMSVTGSFFYMGTRNNDFSNRSQKGAIFVSGAARDIALTSAFFAVFLILL